MLCLQGLQAIFSGTSCHHISVAPVGVYVYHPDYLARPRTNASSEAVADLFPEEKPSPIPFLGMKTHLPTPHTAAAPDRLGFISVISGEILSYFQVFYLKTNLLTQDVLKSKVQSCYLLYLKRAQLALSVNKKVAVLRVIKRNRIALKSTKPRRVKIHLLNVSHAPSESLIFHL